METDSKHLDRVLGSLRRSEKRSALFHWLLDHHDEILDAAGAERINWRAVAERFKEAGLTDATGKPATARTARATWYKVRRVVATRRANLGSTRPVKLMPSKLPRDAGPALTPEPAPAPAVPLRDAVPVAGDWPTPNLPALQQKLGGPPGERKLTGAEQTERLRERLRTRNY